MKEVKLSIDENGWTNIETIPPIKEMSFEERIKFIGLLAMVESKLITPDVEIPEEIQIKDKVYKVFPQEAPSP